MAKVFLIYNTARYLARFRFELIEALRKRGHEVCAVVPLSDPATAILRERGVRCLALSISDQTVTPFDDLEMLFRLWLLCRREKPDVVLNFTIKPNIYGSIAARLARVPSIVSTVTGLGYIFTGNSIKHRALRKVVLAQYRFAMHFNHYVCFQNPDDKRFFVQSRIVREDQSILVNGSGVDLDHFCSVSRRAETRIFLLVARLLWDKGIGEYVGASRLVKELHPECEFWLVGPYDNNPASISREHIEGWVNEGAIRYFGETNDVRPYLAQASVYVLPSYREGTPRTVLEAMATGLPIITTDAPGCRETVIEGYNGYLVPVKNSQKLAERMLEFVRHPELCIQMGAMSRRLAQQKYDVVVVNDALLGALGLH